MFFYEKINIMIYYIVDYNKEQNLKKLNKKSRLEKKEEIKEKNNKKLSTFSIGYVIIVTILAILTFLVAKINILPNKYLTLFIVITVVFCIILGALNIKRDKKIAKIFYYILLIPTILISIIGLKGLYSAYKVFDSFNKSSFVSKKFYLVTDEESLEYNNNSEEEVGVIGLNKSTSIAFDKFKEENKYIKKEYKNIIELTNKLISNDLHLLFLSEGEYNLIIETVPNIKEKLRIIHEFILEEKIEEKEEPKKEKDNGAFVIYIAGIDTRSGVNVDSTTDVNIICTVNPKTNQVLLTNIPRDTYVQLKDTTGLKDKLTHAGSYGINMSKGTLEDLLDIKIDNFVRINFEGVVNAINYINGVTIFNDRAFNVGNDYFGYGNIYLDGRRALIFSRERHKMLHGDFDRGKNQQKIIAAVIEKISTNPTLLTKIDNIMLGLSNEIYTDIPVDMVKEYAKNQLDKMPKWNIKSNALEVKGANAPTYSIPNQELYVGIVNEESLNKIKNEINNVLEAE